MFEAEQIHQRFGNGEPSPESKVILFSRRDVLVTSYGEFPSGKEIRALLAPENSVFRIGTIDGRDCFCSEISAIPDTLPQNLIKRPSRALLSEPSPDNWNALCRGREIVYWKKQHRFCGACRTELQASDHDTGLVCPECGMRYYPQIAPAVITAVTRNNGKELLLAHNFNFETDVYGLIAGFIEAGESAEQAVEREVAEETKIRVGNIRYLSSQTWPFPNSLMLAFHAEYLSGEAEADGTEIEKLGWFSRDNLPKLPPKGSIARAVIARFFDIDTGK